MFRLYPLTHFLPNANACTGQTSYSFPLPFPGCILSEPGIDPGTATMFCILGPLLLFLFPFSTPAFSLSFPPPAPPGLRSRTRMYLFHKSSSLDGSIGINLISGPVVPTLPTLYFHNDPASRRLIPLPCLVGRAATGRPRPFRFRRWPSSAGPQ